MEREEVGPTNLGAAVLVLQTPSSAIDGRIAALRYIYRYASDPSNNVSVDARLRKNINELVLSTVLSISMSDDRISDLRRRQLIRAECFLILGKLLESNTLFGNIREKIDEIEAHNTTLALTQQEEADRDDELTIDLDGDGVDYGRNAVRTVRQSMSAGEARGNKHGSFNTPERRRTPGRPDTKGSPEVKFSSPTESSMHKQELDQALTFMLPPIPDGWVDPDSPSTVVSYHSDGTYETLDTKDATLDSGVEGDSPAKKGGKPRPRMGPPGGWVREDKPGQSPVRSPARSSGTHTLQVGIMNHGGEGIARDLAYSKSGSSIVGGSLSLIEPVIFKQPRKLLKNKKLHPRPSGFLGGDYTLDNFAPGVDPTDWFEQDKRLGYQKPRMFFPIPVAPDLDKGLLPEKRKPYGAELKVDDVVQEFLQMRAMLSYVGDQILIPYSAKSKKITKTEQGVKALTVEGHFGDKTAKPLRRLAGVLGDGLYEEAVQQAMSVWTPLVGANLPGWAIPGNISLTSAKLALGQKDPTQYKTSLKLGENYGNTPMERPAWEPVMSKTVKTGLNVIPRASDIPEGLEAEQAVLLTKKMLRSLVRKESRDRRRTLGAMQKTMDILVRNDYVSREVVEDQQDAIMDSLAEEEKTIYNEINAIKQLSLDTVKAQYATLPKRFLLLIEGKKANPRQLIIKMTETFCKVRSRNWMVLAFGTWKAHYILAESARRAPIYARTAACYLMKEWATNRKLKQMKKQLQTWSRNVARIIFVERNKKVLPIQTLYRRYRDRCILLRMHMQGAYDGPLSDIELGEERNLLFKVPAIIRSTRRDIWHGVIRIQTNFRRWWVYRHTLKRRRQVILLQSVIRMFPVRERFKRIKYHTIRMQAYARRTIARNKWCFMKIQAVILQKYVRRYLRVLWKARLFHKAWRIQEKRMAAAILIQCRWREYKAKKRVYNIVTYRKDREWGALVMQRVWFKRKRAFHTFVLMCCLRAAETAEQDFDKYITFKRRYFASRLVQREYAKRFFRRNISAAVKIQCKYRGYHGYNVMEILRREKWACRRLCHWARGALKRTMKRVRQIQRCWWNYKRGNLMRHLGRQALLEDQKADKIRKDKRYLAACKVQAMIHGIFARRWVRRTRAASKIQKPARMFIARRNWKRQTKARNRGAIMNYITKMVTTQIKIRTKEVIRIHSIGMIKPQALVRGFIIRTQFNNATAAAHTFAKAVVKIQRCWRSSGAMAQAVAEVMARKRAATNPFRDCGSLHRLLRMYYLKAEKLYSTRDPRAGMKVSTLLYRIGLSYLNPMFPSRQFATVDDLRELDLPTMEEMYSEWQSYEEKKRSMAGDREKKRRPPIPTLHLKSIIDIAKPVLVPRSPTDIASVQLAQHFVEATGVSPAAAAQRVQIRFIKKFGQAQSSRALNLGEKIKQCWYGYNNHKALGTLMTPGMISLAIEDAPTDGGSSVWTTVQGLMTRSEDPKQLKQEAEYDKKRIAECMELSQLAVEQARVLLLEEHDYDEDAAAADPILVILTKAHDRVVSYKRKYMYMKDKMIAENTVMSTEPAQDGHNNIHFQWALPERRHNEVLSVSDSIDLPFLGSRQQFDLELNISIVKVYQDAFNALYTASSGVQGLKTKWFIYTVRKAIRDSRTKRFLEEKTDAYMHDRHADHVTENWLKFKRADAVARKFRAMLQEMEESKRIIKEFLQFIPQYGWEEQMDDQGYAYYVDTLDRDLDPTYDMPRYLPKHWKSVSAIQRQVRILFKKLKEFRRLKEEAKAREMALIEERWMEEVRKGKKSVRIDMSERTNNIKERMLELIVKDSAEEDMKLKEEKRQKEVRKWKNEYPGQAIPPHLLPPVVSTDAATEGSKSDGEYIDASLFADGSEDALENKHKKILDQELEHSIPWRLQFAEDPILSSGMWVLLRTEIPKDLPKSAEKPASASSDKGDLTERTPRKKTPPVIKKKGRGYGGPKKAAPDPFDTSRNPYLVKSGEFVYESVVIFKLRKVQKARVIVAPTTSGGVTIPAAPYIPEFETICDTKNFRGVRNVGVSMDRICLMNLEIDAKIECRYQKTIHFYRGKITGIFEDHLLRTVYGVLYDDGETERNVLREMLRPSPEGLRLWFDERNAQIKDAVMYLARKRHFEELRANRENRAVEKGYYTYKSYIQNLPLEDVEQEYSKPEKPLGKARGKGKAKDVPEELNREQQKAKDAADKAAAIVLEQERVLARTEKQRLQIDDLFEDEHDGEFFQKAQEAQSVHIVVTKLSFRYGWVEQKLEEGATEIVYKHSITGATTTGDNPPIYRPEHDFSARKLQNNWKIRRSRKYFTRLLASQSLDEIVRSSIKRYQKFAWIGYGTEGLTVMMTLRRMGYFMLADTIEEKFKYKKDQLHTLTLQGIVGTPPDLYERLGVIGVDKIKAFKDFQMWYNKTPSLLRDKNAQLINYYSGVDDERTLQEVIASGEAFITEKFLKIFPQGAARTQKSTRQVAMTSLYPHSSAMIDMYLKKYGDKADPARENVHELISKKTTSQWQEEKEAYQVLMGSTLRLKSLLGGFKLKQIHDVIIEAIEQATEAMSPITGISPKAIKAAEAAKRKKGKIIARKELPSPEEEIAAKKAPDLKKLVAQTKKEPKDTKKKERDDCSGPEARAALILRVKVMNYMQTVLRAVAILQRSLRGFTKRSSVWKVIHKRRNAISLMQRSMRGCMDRTIAADLREQQKSPWEQLWDANRELLYYYNRSSGKSTYLEPGDAYRPLVRDRLSQVLVQAWPFIDADRETSAKSDYGLPPGLAAFAPSLAMCCVCETRKCVRLCVDCGTLQNNASLSKKKGPDKMPYCFPCFTLRHSTDETENHNFIDATIDAQKDSSGLICCMCTEEPATRKCQGILDDSQIEDLCAVLQRSVSRLWPEILAKANVGGERKLAMLLEGIMGSSSDTISSQISPSQLQQVRMMLERTRTECDEVYCDYCYQEVHAGGKRALHKWIGFQANAPVCNVCKRSPGEVVCKECDNSAYCNSCFRVFHAMGRKRKHKHVPLQEELAYGQTFCLVCTRRAGTVLCQNILAKGEDGRCSKRHCESCFSCTHKPICDAAAKDFSEKETAFLMKRGQAPPDPNIGEEGKVCCLCGEDADTKCVQCGDLYCSRTWMGNPGCFVTCHTKGEKAKHKTITLASLAPKAPPPGGYGAWAPVKKKPVI